ncbi:MAG: hypothetical protein HQL73_09765, partial [Magnetococcales bacterium]|nr:hypothetical protein [Magnetococcales bacterium]
YVSALPDIVARWVPHDWASLGTDGFGRSDGRTALREFFEVDRRAIVLTALHVLGHRELGMRAMKDFGIDPDGPNPITVPGDYWRERR